MTADPEETPGGAAPPQSEHVTETSATAAEAPRRRIAIGTQRAGVAPPKLAPRHVLVTGPAAPAASSPQPAAQPAPPVLSADGFAAADVAAAGAAPSRDGEAAAVASVQAAPPPGEVPQEAGLLPAAAPPADGLPAMAPGGSGSSTEPPKRGRRGRDRRGADAGPSPFAIPTPNKRVSVPSIRQPLEDDLEHELADALAGVEVDALLDSAAAEKLDAPLAPGARVSGTVVSLTDEVAFLDLGGRRQAALSLIGLDPEEMPAVGDQIDVSVGSRSDDDGLYDVALANHAVAVEDWSQLEPGMIVEGRVMATNKGGLEVDVGGLRGFMPAGSVSTWRVENLEEFVGQTLECLVTELVPAARRLVLSRRAVLERQAAEAREKLLETLEVGQTVEGIVRNIRDFGAFVDIGNGVDGLVHVSQLSWDRIEKPEDVLTVGQKINVVVKKVDRQTGKISLSAKDLIESPWHHADEKYPIGSTQRGTVSRIAQFGAFIKLEPGVEGLVHVSELAHRHVRSVGDVLKEGETVECRVLAVDPEEQRMSLSIKAVIAPPAAAGASGEPADDVEPAKEEPPPPPPRTSNKPLKGGLGQAATGERFGLKW